MDINYIKNKVNSYELCSIEDIEEIIKFIVNQKKQNLNMNFDFEIVYEEGGRVKTERSQDGYLQLEIGDWPLAELKGNKELGLDVDSQEERKEFIELILQTFHELRHIEQYFNIQDRPNLNEDTIKMTREKVINDFFLGFINQFNYEQSMMEIDAMRTSLQEAVYFFQSMGADITPNEVLNVMKEKELRYLDYNLQDFGDTYESAILYFNSIYGNFNKIKGIPKIIESLSPNVKMLLYSECQDLINEYNLETDIEKKLDILEEIALRLMPELKERYPLADIHISTKKI